MEYSFAPSYKNYEMIGKPFLNDKNKLYAKAKCKCDRCVNGVYVAGVENGMIKPHPAYNGVCLKCGGEGYIYDTLRVYTAEEYKKYVENQERRKAREAAKREKEDQEMIAKAAETKREWLKKKGFDPNTEITYAYLLKDSYSRKDELKACGFSYDSVLGWHSPVSVSAFEGQLTAINASDVYSFNAFGTGYLKDGAYQIVKDMAPKDEVDPGEYLEEEEKVKDLSVVYCGYFAFAGFRGQTTYCYTFKHNNCVVKWFTTKILDYPEGANLLISGKIKNKEEYKGVKQTILTRCTIREA